MTRHVAAQVTPVRPIHNVKHISFATITLIVALCTGCLDTSARPDGGRTAALNDSAIVRAFDEHSSDVEVEGSAVVSRVLPDDRSGSRHQRFLLRLTSGRTLLVAHNIDLAERIDGLQAGDTISFRGEYVWNEKGGMLHWTHHDPQGRHSAGWVKYKGKTYR
jgi:hypothetical protein